MVRRLRHLGDRGASAIEYALIVVAIAAILVPVVFALHERVGAVFCETCVTATKAGPGGPITDAEAEAECKALPGPATHAP